MREVQEEVEKEVQEDCREKRVEEDEEEEDGVGRIGRYFLKVKDSREENGFTVTDIDVQVHNSTISTQLPLITGYMILKKFFFFVHSVALRASTHQTLLVHILARPQHPTMHLTATTGGRSRDLQQVPPTVQP